MLKMLHSVSKTAGLLKGHNERFGSTDGGKLPNVRFS